jgi:prepilin-type N-terminal cleavage/methylation domain-containing protein
MQARFGRHRDRGFTLTELAVVFAIVTLLIGSATTPKRAGAWTPRSRP